MVGGLLDPGQPWSIYSRQDMGCESAIRPDQDPLSVAPLTPLSPFRKGPRKSTD